MLRKPRNARTDRLTDWWFFVQIYLVCAFIWVIGLTFRFTYIPVHWFDDVAWCYGHLVPLHGSARPSFL